MALPAPDVGTSAVSLSSAPKNPVAELRNGKVIFRQKPVSFEKASETMQEIVKFREMLNARLQNQDQPLTSIPDHHKPLIVKLAQESDKGVAPLAKHIRSILLPDPGEIDDAHRSSLESSLPISVVEHAIQTVMARVNYGLDGPLGQKLPATVCVWRWEVRDTFKDWLPRSARDNADARLAERIQASAELRATFESLAQTERDAILVPKGAMKLPTKDINQPENIAVPTSNSEKLSEDHILKEPTIDIVDGETLSENHTSKGRVRKAFDPEKAAKIKEKEEKRAAKADKEKKQKEAQDKSRSIMANFFGKIKSSVRGSPSKDSNACAGPSVDSEFQRTFRPFVLKKDAECAPYNWFLDGKRSFYDHMTGITQEDAIILDDETPAQGILNHNMSSGGTAVSIPWTDPPATLQEFIAELHRRSLNPCQRMYKVPSFKACSPRVRDIVSQLNDAEIAGEPTQVRHFLSILRDRQVFPAKVFIFHEDSRPGYYGTWTRASREVGPRTPLKRDILARDYGYDSGEEWGDEGAGDADDVVEDAEDDEQDAEDADSDLDSWLVDDEDENQSPADLEDLSPPPLDLPMPPPKRKAEKMEKRPDKKRKVVVPLVPHVKGPFWESHIGRCEHDPFQMYRIQLFNDTPYPIDPFAFIPVASDDERNPQVDFSLTGPPLPGAGQTLVGTGTQSISRRTINAAPKTAFPEAHLNVMLAKITDLATPNFTYLVESIYQDLRIHKIRKNAIEAKVREIGEKCKDKKVWIVKQIVEGASHQLS